MSTNVKNPDSIVIEKIAELLPAGQLIATCEHSPNYSQVCQDPNFWKRKVELDYGVKFQNQISSQISWQKFYVNVYENKIFPYEVLLDEISLGSTYWILNSLDLFSSLKLFLDKVKPTILEDKNSLLVQLDDDSVIIRSKLLWSEDAKYLYKSSRPNIDQETKKVMIITKLEEKQKVIDLILPL
jgi:hypothetical protein